MKKISSARSKSHWSKTEVVHVAVDQDFLFEGWTKEPPPSEAEKRKLQKIRQSQADENREKIYYEWAYGTNSHGFVPRDSSLPYQRPPFQILAEKTTKRSGRFNRRPSVEYKGPEIILVTASDEARIYAYEQWRLDKSKPFEPLDVLTYYRLKKAALDI